MRELKIKDITWVSLTKPSGDDIQKLGQRFPQIHPLVLEELATLTIRPRVENYDHHLFMVLHFPKFVPGPEKSIAYELDFILMADVLITVQYDDISVVENFWQECTDKKSAGDRYGKSPVHLLYYLLRLFYSNALRELDQIQEEVDRIEEIVFSGPVKEILEDISILKRDILDFRRALKPQHLTLESLILQGPQLYGEKTKPFLADLLGEYLKVWNLLETHKETIDALYETSNSLLTAKINELIRAFTVLAFIAFIPTIVTSIFSMNFRNIPLTAWGGGFWIVIAGMVILSWLIYMFLKWRKLI